MQCLRCKFAEWNRTEAGRLHPSGMGRCTWQKTFQIAAAARAPGSFGTEGQPITVQGNLICRKKGDEYPVQKCPVFQPTD